VTKKNEKNTKKEEKKHKKNTKKAGKIPEKITFHIKNQYGKIYTIRKNIGEDELHLLFLLSQRFGGIKNERNKESHIVNTIK